MPTFAQALKPTSETGNAKIIVVAPAMPIKPGKNIFTLKVTPPPANQKDLSIALMMMPDELMRTGQPMGQPRKEPKTIPVVLRPGTTQGTFLLETQLNMPGTWRMLVKYSGKGDISNAVFSIPVSF